VANYSLSKIYLIVPKLIEQQTWGGKYILRVKKWLNHKSFKNLKIGQSYELFSGSKLRSDISTTEDPSFTGELGFAMDPEKIIYSGNKRNLFRLDDLIRENSQKFLGLKPIKIFGPTMRLLIKLTQAKGNSFQLHVKEKDNSQKWHYKAESWYYFRPGLLTLGVKENTDWELYRNYCHEVNKKMTKLSLLVKKGKINLIRAQLKARKLLLQYDLKQFVNTIKTKRGDLIDLSEAGLHHSWEEDETDCPDGNILYEICLDEMDPVSSLRCFDKGKFTDDGNLRKIDIDDYFKHIDRSPKANNPKTHKVKPHILLTEPGVKIWSLLRTKYYALDKIRLKSGYCGLTAGSFHHLYFVSGQAEIKYYNGRTIISKGHACFVPAALSQYEIIPLGNKPVEILKTFIN
jgi:mannose-6-phosphate isomerase class I